MIAACRSRCVRGEGQQPAGGRGGRFEEPAGEVLGCCPLLFLTLDRSRRLQCGGGSAGARGAGAAGDMLSEIGAMSGRGMPRPA